MRISKPFVLSVVLCLASCSSLDGTDDPFLSSDTVPDASATDPDDPQLCSESGEYGSETAADDGGLACTTDADCCARTSPVLGRATPWACVNRQCVAPIDFFAVSNDTVAMPAAEAAPFDPARPNPPNPSEFRRRVAQAISEKCIGCHNILSVGGYRGSLRLDAYYPGRGFRSTRNPARTPQALWNRFISLIDDGTMPPTGAAPGDPRVFPDLTAAEKADVLTWARARLAALPAP
jgi:hypothetical protein